MKIIKSLKYVVIGMGISLTTMSFLKAEIVQFQNIHVGGTGCPSEKTQIVYSPDNSSASLIFQDFQSHVPVEVTNIKQIKTISQLPCNVFVEVKLPIGQKLDSLEIKYDMRGNASLDKGVLGYFRSYVMSSSGLGTERGRGRSPELIQEKNWANIMSDQFEDFVLSTSKKINFTADCRVQNGQDRVYIQLQHHLFTQLTRGYENSNAQGTIMMDTSDITGGIKLIASTSACNGGGTVTPPRNCRIVRVNGRAQQICE
jgi:hypothetical protein